MGKAHGFSVDWTEDETVFDNPATLFKYNAILFLTSRDVLDDAGQTALRVYIEGGGAFIGVHNAFGTNYNWDWFRGLLGGPSCTTTPPSRPARSTSSTPQGVADHAGT
jgi:uncharacterized protein